MNAITEQYVIRAQAHFPFIQPINFGYGACQPLHTGGARVVNQWILHYVFAGTGIFETRGQTYHPKTGDLFIIRPNEHAFYAADKEDPWTYGWFNFYSEVPLPEVLEQDVITDPRLGKVFLSAYEQRKNCTPENQDSFLYGKIFELLGLLRTLYPSPFMPSNSQLIHTARQYMNEHARERISIEEVAKVVHMDTSHFVTLFREHTGTTPWQYLTNKRLSHATSALLTKGITVKAVAEWVGYADVTSFSRSFKRLYGMSPTEYAKRYAPYAQRRNYNYETEK